VIAVVDMVAWFSDKLDIFTTIVSTFGSCQPLFRVAGVFSFGERKWTMFKSPMCVGMPGV
jgi:hypothetical protein